MAGAGGPGRGRATASCALLGNASGKCRPACGWEAGRHLVPQLRRGTTLRPFPDRQHARPPLRPRPFGPIVRAIRTWAGIAPVRAPAGGRASFWGRCCSPPARGLPSAAVRSYLHFCPAPAPCPLGLAALSPVRGGHWQEGGGSFLTSLLPWASALPPGPAARSPVRGGRWQRETAYF